MPSVERRRGRRRGRVEVRRKERPLKKTDMKEREGTKVQDGSEGNAMITEGKKTGEGIDINGVTIVTELGTGRHAQGRILGVERTACTVTQQNISSTTSVPRCGPIPEHVTAVQGIGPIPEHVIAVQGIGPIPEHMTAVQGTGPIPEHTNMMLTVRASRILRHVNAAASLNWKTPALLSRAVAVDLEPRSLALPLPWPVIPRATRRERSITNTSTNTNMDTSIILLFVCFFANGLLHTPCMHAVRNK